MLGLPTMSLFDLIAKDMRASFTTTPDVTPYTAIEPKQSLFERNPALSAMTGPAREAALATMKMRFDVPDAAPTEQLNRIVWGLVKGWHPPYPAVRKAVFSPLRSISKTTNANAGTNEMVRAGRCSSALRHGHRRRSQHLVADPVAMPDHADDEPVLIGRCRRAPRRWLRGVPDRTAGLPTRSG